MSWGRAGWLRIEIEDAQLADPIEAVETARAESRAKIRAEIEERYTPPADKASGLIDPPA